MAPTAAAFRCSAVVHKLPIDQNQGPGGGEISGGRARVRAPCAQGIVQSSHILMGREKARRRLDDKLQAGAGARSYYFPIIVIIASIIIIHSAPKRRRAKESVWQARSARQKEAARRARVEWT